MTFQSKVLLLGFFSLLTSGVCFAQNPEVCVLNFLKRPVLTPQADLRLGRHHPIWRTVHDVFKDQPGVLMVLDPLPSHIRKCVEQGVREIVVITHTVTDPKTQRTTLAYNRPLDDEEKLALVKDAHQGLEKEQSKILEEVKKLTQAPLPEKAVMAQERLSILGASQAKVDRIETHLEKLHEREENPSMLSGDIVYGKLQPITDQVFFKLKGVLKEASQSGHPYSFKKIRFALCGDFSEIKKIYPTLAELESEFQVEIDVHPVEHGFANWIQGGSSRRWISTDWLKQSLIQ